MSEGVLDFGIALALSHWPMARQSLAASQTGRITDVAGWRSRNLNQVDGRYQDSTVLGEPRACATMRAKPSMSKGLVKICELRKAAINPRCP